MTKQIHLMLVKPDNDNKPVALAAASVEIETDFTRRLSEIVADVQNCVDRGVYDLIRIALENPHTLLSDGGRCHLQTVRDVCDSISDRKNRLISVIKRPLERPGEFLLILHVDPEKR